MAKYTSRFIELSFYVNGVERKFNGGVYTAATAAEEAVLDRLTDAKRVDSKPKDKVEEVVAEKEPEQEPKPAPRARKPSAK